MKENVFARRFNIIRRRWNDLFWTFSFLITEVEERNSKSNREEDTRKFQWGKRQTTLSIELRNILFQGKSCAIRKCVLFYLKNNLILR